MKVTTTKLEGVLILEPEVYEDDRGHFFESWNEQAFNMATGFDVTFVQDNQSSSRKGVLRGLHYQKAPHAQGKLVRALRGKAFDVAVDIRPDSPTFMEWCSINLSGANKKQLWIPEGFAHGFLALEDQTEVAYKATAPYSRESERGIRWSDSTIDIDWPIVPVHISEKDSAAPILNASV
jgi:dTDP-4-dehydrorhamnose 3,5-epimerase